MARFPRQVSYIIGNEACERFSFYGMRNVLTVYLVTTLLADPTVDLGLTQAAAKNVFHTFVMGVYFFPLLGGYLADRYLGKYRTIFYLSILYTLGQLCLVLFSTDKSGFYTGLTLIAIGSGGIKPCVAAFVGDQFDESNKHLSRSIFGLFYWIINFGSFFASLTIPLVLREAGPGWAFGIPGILMAISTLVLWLGRDHYVHVPPQHGKQHGGLGAVLWQALQNKWANKGAKEPDKPAHFLDRAASHHNESSIVAAKAVWKILPLFAMVSMFWAIFDQKASTMVLQGKAMDRNVLGFTLAESQMQAINPMLVMLLIPLLNGVVYPLFERRGQPLRPLVRMCYGIALAGVAFACVAGMQFVLDFGTKLHILWQILPYVILTVAEVLVSTTGLEFAYSQAPLSVKGVIMSLWTLTVALGNFLVVVITSLAVFSGGWQILFFAALAWIAALLFWSLARRYVSVEHFRQT